MNKQNIAMLSEELNEHRYILNHEYSARLFKEITANEYTALREIARAADPATGRAYLKEMAADLHLTIHQASRRAALLRDRGLIAWAHEGNGSEGTYLALTPNGAALMERQRVALAECAAQVAEKFGEEKMRRLLELAKELEAALIGTLEEGEEFDDEED